MNLTSPKTIKELLTSHGAAPSKTMGQNFLIDAHVLGKIMTTADVKPTDTVLEIGPGIGTLTQVLAEKAKNVICIEKDYAMVEILKQTLKGLENVQVIADDALHGNYSLPTTNYKLVANIPYYITSPLIRKFLETANQPESIVLMVQREVAQRICAKPPEMSLLALSVQFYAKPKIIATVPKGCFWPVPNVDSAILQITPFKDETRPTANLFFTITKAGFMWPRKQLGSNLAKALQKDKEWVNAWLLKNTIDPMRRAETLSLAEWISLAHSF